MMTKEHFVILGGGISGLSLAWHLKKKYQDRIQLTIVEKSSRAGGWIRSNHEHGFLFEEGPRSCRTKGAGIATLELIEELGLKEEIISASPVANKRYLYVDKQLQCLPHGIISMLCSPMMRHLLPALCQEWFKARSNCEDESIYNFFKRRFSLQIAERFIDPMVSGIYAGDIRQLSMQSCFSQFHAWEQEYGSVMKGVFFDRSSSKAVHSPFVQAMRNTPVFSFKQGMETLVKALAKKLHEHIHFNSQAVQLKIGHDKIQLDLANSKVLNADRVFLAMPGEATISLLKHSFPSMKTLFPAVTAASVAVVNLGWSESVLNYSGFGYLIPSSEQEKILGVVWDSSVFPEQNRTKNETRLTAMIGGARHPEMVDLPPLVLQQYAQSAIKQHLRIDTPPQAVHVHKAIEAIPQYLLGHSHKLKQLEGCLTSLSSRLTLHGSAWHGVAVNDCILKSKELTSR